MTNLDKMVWDEIAEDVQIAIESFAEANDIPGLSSRVSRFVKSLRKAYMEQVEAEDGNDVDGESPRD